MTTSLAPIEFKNDSQDGWPSLVDMKVICAGLVRYSDLKDVDGNDVTGDIFVTKEFLDRIAATLEGKPIINWDHRDVNPKEYSKGKFQGIITGPAVFNLMDGWYHASGYVWDDATRKNIENGYSISCAYTISEWGDGPGTHNQVPYLNQPMNGSYTHIAVVPVPRYEGANIELLNSLPGGPNMGMLSLFRKDKSEEKIEIDLEKTTTLVNGKTRTVSELVKAYETKNKAEAHTLKDDDLVEVGGKKVTVRELKNAMEDIENAEESVKMDNAHNDGDHESVPMVNCVKCNAVEEEKKNAADEERKNKEDEEKKKDEEAKNAAEKEKKDKDEEVKNSLKADRAAAAKRAAVLDERRNAGHKAEMPTVSNLQAQAREGEKRYGSASK